METAPKACGKAYYRQRTELEEMNHSGVLRQRPSRVGGEAPETTPL